MSFRFDERQAESFPEEVRDLHCFLSETTSMAGTLLHPTHEFGFACDDITRVKRSDV